MGQVLIHQHRRGFMVMDVVGGLVLVSILATVLAVMMNRQNRTQQKLADSRAAVRLAEQVITQLQAGGDKPAGNEESRVAIRKLQDLADVPGMAWIEVEAVVRDGHAVLIGLVPGKSVPEEGRAP